MSSILSGFHVKKYLSRLKLPENADKLQDFRTRKKNNDEKYLEKVHNDEEKYEHKKELDKARAKRYRERKKDHAMQASSLTEISPKPLTTSFKSRSKKTKAIKKIEKSLPKSDAQKKEVIREMMTRHDVTPAQEKLKKPRKSFDGIPDLIKIFYESDGVSRLMPGMRDYISIKNSDGTIEKKQKYLMIVTVKEAHQEFLKTFPDKKCSVSYFKKLRPRHIKLKSDSVHYSCLCVHCENFKLLCEAISPYFIENAPKSSVDLLEFLCCDRDNFECCNNDCLDCQNFMEELKTQMMPCCEDESVKYEKWDKNKENNFTEKITMPNKKVSDVLKDFQEAFPYFKLHKFIQKTQKNYLIDSKDKLEENEVILIVDYAEKLATQFQNAVQSAYFGSRTISIFTAHAYVGKHAQYSFALASDNVKQSKFEVFASLKYIIGQLKSRHPNIEHIKIFSDGCGGQFKNRYQFKNLLFALEDHGVSIELSFFATGHGKSPCDGIGATVKRHVRYCVLSEKFKVVTARDFVECAKSFTEKIKVYELTQEEIDTQSQILKQRWNEKHVKPIPGTMKFHSFKIADIPNSIKAAVTSLDHSSKIFALI